MATTALKGTPVTTVGELPAVGDQAPEFVLVGQGLTELSLSDITGRKVLNIFPSVDTGVCAASVRRFNELAAGLENTTVINISEDLPFAQARFCGAEGIENAKVGSTFRSTFGEEYGVKLADGPMAGLLGRAVIVVDENNQVLYTELIPEITTEPDYDAAVAALS